MSKDGESLRDSQKRILEDISRLGTAQWVSRLTEVPAEEIWTIIRWSILALKTRIHGNEEAFQPPSRALTYLYSLVRFIEAFDRFPSKDEQGHLFELSLLDTRVSSQDKGPAKIPEMSVLLAKAARSSKAKKLRNQQQKRKRVMAWSTKDEELFLGSSEELHDHRKMEVILRLKTEGYSNDVIRKVLVAINRGVELDWKHIQEFIDSL
jgi:hypothetical protein